ncbi:MAG: SufB/SufD family protein [Nitrososphaeraceae archaeon]
MYNLTNINKENDKIISASKEPSWMLDLRKEASEKYDGLPFEVSSLYAKYSNANHLLPDYIYFKDDNTKSNYLDDNQFLSEIVEHKDLENENNIICINSEIQKLSVSEKMRKDGFVISSISEGLSDYSDIIKEHLTHNKLDFNEDKYLALSSSYYQNGYFIYIPKNMIIEDPIRIVNYLSPDGYSSISRNIIISDTSSKSMIVQELYSSDNKDSKESKILKKNQQACFELLDTHIHPNSQLEMVTLQALDYNSVNFSNRKAFVEKDGKMSWYLSLFGSQLSRYKIDSIMKGSGASAEDLEILFGIGNQSFDVTSNLVHIGPNTKGRVLVKSVMKDTSQSLFKGMIKINKQAQHTESFLAGHAILLDKGAKSDAIPGLEIEANEVKATHSASVAQIDQNQIFYLMCRGLSEELAKREIVNGFLEPMSRRMGPTIRAWINYLIENKWLGKKLILKTDEAMEQILEVEKTRYRETEDIFEKHYKYR